MIVLELNIFQKKLENSMKMKILQQIFTEYECVDTCIWFVDSMIKGTRLLSIQIHVLLSIIKRMTK